MRPVGRARSGRRALLAGLAGLALSACQLPGGGEPGSLYTLTPKTTFDAGLPKVEWQLLVEPLIAAAGLNTSRIALQHSPLTLDYYAQSNWTDRAPLMVQTLLVESFENTGRILGVARDSAGLRADYILKTELREFQAEYGGAGPPLVRVRINAKLVRMPDRAIVANNTVERTERAATNDMAAIVGAFDEALGGVLRRIVEWTLKAVPAAPPGPPRRGGPSG